MKNGMWDKLVAIVYANMRGDVPIDVLGIKDMKSWT